MQGCDPKNSNRASNNNSWISLRGNKGKKTTSIERVDAATMKNIVLSQLVNTTLQALNNYIRIAALLRNNVN
jgi:hypothetical protein